ncbi:ribonuclease H-like domain-containing protein [Paenibacillus sp. GCM10027627]|uniref:ribonuclease H-like domain-containing protein n=1 Tax=unclassified Paenibacillus TaxID=185978 RepID=UPI00362C1228
MSRLKERMGRLRGSSVSASGNSASLNEGSGHIEEALADSQRDEATSQEGHDFIESNDTEMLHPAWSGFGVKLAQNEWGQYLVRKTAYPLAHCHGTHAIGELTAAASGLIEFHPNEEGVAPEGVLYLDLETTGLGVGAGNVPFMIGIGYLEGDFFVIEQTLIRHPAEEYAMLHDLRRKLRNYTFLATYNGKTFDWPLVQNRFIMNGIDRKPWQPLHLDFLHPSRSIWRNTLTSCKLSHIEEERLGISREDDVPGSLAPQLYFQFLADGDPSPLEGVFKHNESDLLSLACLSIRFGYLLQEGIFDRIPYPTEAEELVRTGLWLEKMGKGRLSELLFALVCKMEDADPSPLLRLASRDKKAGNWERAVLLWQKADLLSRGHPASEAKEACIELAMYYEHRIKDLPQALAYATEALQLSESAYAYQRIDKKQRTEQEGMRNRVMRLRRKLEKQRDKGM